MTKTFAFSGAAALVALTAGLAPATQAFAESVIMQSSGGRTTVVTNGHVVYDGDSRNVGRINCASAADAAMARSMGIVLPVCGEENAGSSPNSQ